MFSQVMLRRYLVEALGTFAFVFFGVGTFVVAGSQFGRAGQMLAYVVFGLTLASMAFAFNYISSAAFNPAITLGLAVARRFPWRYVLPYWVMQCTGALLASSFLLILLPRQSLLAASYGATLPRVGIAPALFLEAVMTFFYMLVSMSTATDKRFNRAIGELARGFTLMLAGLFAGSFTGASLNPARSLAPSLFAGGYALMTVWVYFLGPCLGAVLAAWAYEAIRGGEEYALEAPVGIFEGLRVQKQQMQREQQGLPEQSAVNVDKTDVSLQGKERPPAREHTWLKKTQLIYERQPMREVRVVRHRIQSPQIKARAVRDVLGGRKTLAQVCREYHVEPKVFMHWKKEFLAQAHRQKAMK